jgi:hypothetical protein
MGMLVSSSEWRTPVLGNSLPRFKSKFCHPLVVW